MQQYILSEVQQWLPEIDACQIDLENSSVEKQHHQELTQIIENLLNWATTILEKANLPSTSHEAKALLNKYSHTSDEGCALHIVIELDALQASLRNIDSNTAAISGMKLFETIWKRAITTKHQPKQESNTKQKKDNLLSTSQESEENLKLYQKTINELKTKYPHCNVNALRLLASTRLNVTKQKLDDLGISPE